MDDQNKPALPNSWKWVALNEITQNISLTGKKIKQDDYLDEGKFPVIDQGEEKVGGYTNSSSKLIDGNPPFVVFGDHTKVVKYIGYNFAPGADGIKVLSPKDGIHPKLFTYFLKYASKKIPSKGYARHFQYLKKESIPLPPRRSQKKIVEKIEELFSDLDNGIENLKKAKQQLETYKQSVLKAVFEGKLTKEWREEQDNLPTPEELKQQIEEERKKYREQQLEEWKQEVNGWEEQGEPGRKPRKPRKLYKAEPFSNQDEKYPDKWVRIRLCKICSDITDGDHQAPPKAEKGIPFITISNIENNEINFSDTFYVNKEYYNSLKNSRRPQFNDILYTVTGSFGIPVLVNFKKNFCFQRHIGLLRSYTIVNKRWFFYLMQSNNVLNQANKDATGTAQKTVSLTGLRQFEVPFMSKDEQEQIVEELDSKLSIISNLDEVLTTHLQNAEALRQSILKKAFEGKLIKEELITETESVPADDELSPFNQMQMIGILISTLEKEFQMAYGEMALAKYLYLIDRIKKYRTGLKFKDWHWGPYDPDMKGLIYKKDGFFQTGQKSTIQIKGSKRETLLKYDIHHRELFEEGVREISQIIGKFEGKKSTSRQLELLATVCKVVENEQSTDLKTVRNGMEKWDTDKGDFKNKAAKFSKKETERCLNFILNKEWEKKLIN